MKSFKFTSFLFLAAFYITVTSAGGSIPHEDIDGSVTKPPGPEIPEQEPATPQPPTPPTPPEDIPIEGEDKGMDVKPADDPKKMNTVDHVKKSPCDVTIKLQSIVNTESLEKTYYTTKVNTTLCVRFETRYSTGYIWALIDVYDSEPTVKTSMFPVDVNQLKDFSSENIVVTRPLPSYGDDGNSEEESGTTNTGVARRPTPVGASGVAFSKIKALKAGIYYVAYAFYRPFNPTESPNTRILILTVE